MSYCRWSSNNFMCDIYAYESVYDCFTIHIAGRKSSTPSPEIPYGGTDEEFKAYSKEYTTWSETRELVDIDLPHAGETFNEPDLESFKARLIFLRELGYKFPESVISDIDEEIEQEKATNETP